MTTETSGQWKKWLIRYFLTAAILSTAVAGFQIAVDPFGIWHSTNFTFNSFKTAQELRESLFKPYQYEQLEPEVVVLGNSRAVFGIAPSWSSEPPKSVYNLAMQASRINEIEQLFHFALDTHPPKIVVLMLSPHILTNGNRTDQDVIRGPLYLHRLKAISTSPLTSLAFKLRDSVFSFDAILLSAETIRMNTEKTILRPFHDRGWHVAKGSVTRINRRAYVGELWRYHTQGNRLIKPVPEALARLAAMRDRAREEGVQLIFVLEPVSADFLLSFDALGVLNGFDQVKRRLAEVNEFVDFSCVGSITANRASYMDSTHYMSSVGAQIVGRLTNRTDGVPADFGVTVNSQNIEAHLQSCRTEYNAWKQSEMELFTLLKENRLAKDAARFKTALNRLFPRLLHASKK